MVTLAHLSEFAVFAVPATSPSQWLYLPVITAGDDRVEEQELPVTFEPAATLARPGVAEQPAPLTPKTIEAVDARAVHGRP